MVAEKIDQPKEGKRDEEKAPRRQLPPAGRKLSNEEAMERTMKKRKKVFEALSEC